MENLLAARSKRLHGDFWDEDGEYELVSSLSTSSHSSQEREEENTQGINDYEVLSVRPDFKFSEENGDTVLFSQKHGFSFYLKALWSTATLFVIAWLYLRWMKIPPSKLIKIVKRKTIQYTSALTCTAQTPPSSSSKPRMVYPLSTDKINKTVEGDCSVKSEQDFDNCGRTNLSSKFERVKDEDATDNKKTSQDAFLGGGQGKDAETRVIRESIQHVETTTTLITRDCGGKLRSAKKSQLSLDAEIIRFNSMGKSIQGSRSPSRSPSPPMLRNEPLSENPVGPVASHCNSNPHNDEPMPNVPPQSSLSSPRSVTPVPPAAQISSRYHIPTSSPSTPLRFDASLASAMQPYVSSTVEPTPQRLAQEFCQNVEIIERVLLKSGTKVDSSRAVELAMMHQSSQMKLQEQEQRYSFQAKRQSSLQLDKYEDYLKELSTAREKCMGSIGRSLNHCVLVCVVLEGGRHAVNLMDALEYFSIKQTGGLLLHMACGCDDNGEADWHSGMPERWSSYFSVRSAFDSILRSVEPSLTRSSEYFFCALSFGLSFVAWRLVHVFIRELHCPSLLHQAVNVSILAMYLAQNPGAWVVVTRNLELYKCWAMVQCVLTAGSFAVAVSWHIKTRNCILERQQQQAQKLQQPHGFDDQVSVCEARRSILHYDDLSWAFTVVPPMVMGLVVLMTTK